MTITLKSVNHRALDIHSHLPGDFDPYEPAVRSQIKKRIARGHVDVRLSFTPLQAREGPGLNQTLFEAYVSAWREAAGKLQITAEIDLGAALRVPGMLAVRDAEDASPEVEQLLNETLEEALRLMNVFREREGAELAREMRACGERIRETAEEMARQRETVIPALRQRLEQRLSELLAATPLDPQRVSQEAAVLADRSDIAEEIARLRVHTQELDQLLGNGGEIGKKLDFLLQEMNRETTTVLSKTSGVGELGLAITDAALEAKSYIEKIREQALNLE
jgi:uncharacterized protein (TIGR00255 family)